MFAYKPYFQTQCKPRLGMGMALVIIVHSLRCTTLGSLRYQPLRKRLGQVGTLGPVNGSNVDMALFCEDLTSRFMFTQ